MVIAEILAGMHSRQGNLEVPLQGETDMQGRSQAGADSRSPAAISEHLAALDVAPALRELVAASSECRSITSHFVEGDYVAVSPGAGGHIAGYVHQRKVSLALSPRRADMVGAQHGWEVSPDSGITSYVQIPAGSLMAEPHRTAALALFLESLDWRASGPSQHIGAGTGAPAPGRPMETCKIHFTHMLGGRCEQCD